jgi:hemerythrin-like domain-containing protein
MKNYINKNIKDLINEFPAIKDVLNSYEIGCTSCNVGTCRLKDIVEIHNLPADDEFALMQKIGRAIYPSGNFEMPVIERKIKEKTQEIKYSPPMQKLVKEHILIKRLIALIPAITDHLKSADNAKNELMNGCTDFISNYADKFHHAKEEDILFKYFEDGMDIINVMYDDHKKGRSIVQSIKNTQAGNNKDMNVITDYLNSYKELLTEHIEKEDKILYPWMDRMLNTGQIGKIYSRFNETDIAFRDIPKKYEEFVNNLEVQLNGGSK